LPGFFSSAWTLCATGTGAGGGADLAITACCCNMTGGLACASGAAPTNALRDGAICAID
jgi:hypothetical protein